MVLPMATTTENAFQASAAAALQVKSALENDLLRIKVEQEKIVLEKLREENRATAERNHQLERATERKFQV